jgi:hypothetical protein
MHFFAKSMLLTETLRRRRVAFWQTAPEPATLCQTIILL